MMCTRVCDSLKISYYCSPKTSYTTVLLLPPPPVAQGAHRGCSTNTARRHRRRQATGIVLP